MEYKEIYALGYEAVQLDDMLPDGHLKSITICGQEEEKQFDNLKDFMDFISNRPKQNSQFYVCTGLYIFFSYLFTQYLVNWELAEDNKINKKDTANEQYCGLIRDGKVSFLKIKYNDRVIKFVDLTVMTTEKIDDVKELYDRVMELENGDFKNLLLGYGPSYSLETYSMDDFKKVGGFDTRKKQYKWFNDHPSLSKENPVLYEVFNRQQKDPKSTLTAPTMICKKGTCKGIKYDCNNMYPSLMASKPLPYGLGRHFGKEDMNKKDYLGLDCTCAYMRIHCYHGYQNAIQDFMIQETEEDDQAYDCTCWYWSFEFREMLRCHPNMDYEILESWQFYDQQLDKCYVDWFKDNYKKYHETGEKMYKRMNVAIIGKFDQKPIEVDQKPFLTEENVMLFNDITRAEPYISQSQYYPLGTAIIAYGRTVMSQILHSEHIPFQNVFYADTDCFVIVDTPEAREYIKDAIPISREFGDWKFEFEGEFSAYSIKRYSGRGKNGVFLEANAGGGKYSEAEYFNPATGECTTTIMVTKKAPGGYYKTRELRKVKGIKKVMSL